MKIGSSGKIDDVPYLALGNDELADMPHVGKTAACPVCENQHVVEYGTDSNGNKSGLLGFVKCGGKTSLVSVAGKLVR